MWRSSRKLKTDRACNVYLWPHNYMHLPNIAMYLARQIYPHVAHSAAELHAWHVASHAAAPAAADSVALLPPPRSGVPFAKSRSSSLSISSCSGASSPWQEFTVNANQRAR